MASKQQYIKMDPISHVLARSDMYVGSTVSRKVDEFVVVNSDYKIKKRTISISPAILRIFIEPLSNVIDNVARSRNGKNKVTSVQIKIDKHTGETSFWNDGAVIPIEMHEEEGCYNHTLIFGNLLTGSNYDDTEDRVDISGLNGLGIKLSNIFSTEFTVEGVDPKNKKYFKQTWTKNMKSPGEPIILNSDKKGYTKITYTPDFKQFKLNGYTRDIISLYKRYIIDAAMITKVNFYLNTEPIPVSSLIEYSKLYILNDQKSLHIKTSDCEVILTESDNFETISFANGVYTPLGGTHIDAWTEAIFRPLVKKLNKPKKPQINIKDVKQFFRLFVVASVKRPRFDSQSKTKLEYPEITANVKKSHISTISKWSVMEKLEDIIRAKEMVVLKKIERKKKYVKIDGLDSANNEGGPRSTECTLILVEGLSAKTYATYGINKGVFDKQGRDWHGILALRGKILNTRNATPSTIAKNAIVSDIIKALGVKTGVDYTIEENYKKLRYGRVLIIVDADCDGVHISGLIQNLFHSLFPSLLKREKAFITAMQTPIVRVFKSKTVSKLFYDENEYKRFVAKYAEKHPNRSISKKYYKGLGTNNESDIDESFGQKLVEFRMDEHAFESMNKAFHKKHADDRKEWLANYDPSNTVLKWNGNKQEMSDLTLSEFINTELIKFSHDDCKRSIPHLIDGLKEGHRKVLYVTFLRNLKYSGKTLKVAQLAGSVAEKSGYHHGEQNLYSTITGMAQSFPGSNNIPLLFRDGQFGSRLSGGKDAANGRYIFTKLDALTRLIFREEDEPLLTFREDDGEKIEPYFYVPIIPMVLVNGNICGIGTGWSSTIPSYNPLELIDNIKRWLDNTELVKLKPWYRGHTGEIVEDSENDKKYVSWGRIEKKGSKTVIEELPVGIWTDKYKEQLERWKEEKYIKDFKNHSTPKNVKFTISESRDGMACNVNNLKLYNTINTSNMCLFTESDQLRKFDTIEEIIDSFCKVRYAYYVKRKKHRLNSLLHSIKFLGNKKRFLECVRDGKIKLFEKVNGARQSRSSVDMIAELEEKGFDKEKGDDEYNYLLRLQFRSITSENIDKLANDIDSLIKIAEKLEKTSESKLWIADLTEFESEYTKWIKKI